MHLADIKVGRVYRYGSGSVFATDYRVVEILEDDGWAGYIRGIQVTDGPWKGNEGILLPDELEEVD